MEFWVIEECFKETYQVDTVGWFSYCYIKINENNKLSYQLLSHDISDNYVRVKNGTIRETPNVEWNVIEKIENSKILIVDIRWDWYFWQSDIGWLRWWVNKNDFTAPIYSYVLNGIWIMDYSEIQECWKWYHVTDVFLWISNCLINIKWTNGNNWFINKKIAYLRDKPSISGGTLEVVQNDQKWVFRVFHKQWNWYFVSYFNGESIKSWWVNKNILQSKL